MIETTYNINDEVWFIHPVSKKAVSGRIKFINIKVDGRPVYRTSNDGKRSLIRTGEYTTKGMVILYTIDDQVRKEGVTINQNELFTTKEQLKSEMIQNINSL